MKINYQKVLDEILKEITAMQKKPKLLLHSCCAPCSTYVIEYLVNYFDVNILYYNPNIYPEEEYLKRKDEQIRLINEIKQNENIGIMDIEYESEKFQQMALGFEGEKEGGARCANCFELRMKKTAEKAKENEYDYFCTTLTVSPHKNAKKINEIGELLEKEVGIKWLYSDFKKNEGYKKSIELSKEYDLYRQDYCGCEYSFKTF
ncbi:MAG TPA: hypothetical protein DEP72_02195 [Clostridiales bacterium]|nr:MAG: hypothetical protein A2Y18_00385 [Clostridiales bacterium GWD2_32_19]HCC06967.1 hypothetical protein [Clostridiales bacterium]